MRDAEARADGHRRDRDERDDDPDRDRRVRRAAERLQDPVADERADHEDVAVREVEELQDDVDERVAERDQRVDAAEREAVDGVLDELVHVGCKCATGRP